LGAGHTVLDVACGSGNTALSAARRRNTVTGIDIVENLIERAKARAKAEGLAVEFLSASAEELPFADASFDYVLSTFGVMFAPDQQRAADELLRVCKPGGTIGLANWTLESFPGAVFRLTAQYMPPSPGTRSPMEWGTVPGLQRLFRTRVTDMRLTDRSIRMRFVSIDAWFETYMNYFGPVNTAYNALDESKRRAYEKDLREAAARYNRAADGSASLAMTYVNVIMQRSRAD
jgi:ubiquinone/menaquinone biosynthesis C-methylase UbiE